MEKKYVIKNFEDGTYLQQDREGWGEDFTMCEFDSLELAVDMVALQPYGNFTIEIIYKKLKIMEKKQSSVEQVFSHIKASRNDIQYWNDSMLVDWLLEQEDRLKVMHKEEIVESHHEGYYSFSHSGEQYYNETFGGETE